jgi:hypothetical protein
VITPPPLLMSRLIHRCAETSFDCTNHRPIQLIIGGIGANITHRISSLDFSHKITPQMILLRQYVGLILLRRAVPHGELHGQAQ